MNSYSYDLHIHSCLSPCGDDEMTPNNLVNMAAIAGCEIIAITDHNTCKNAPAVIKAGESVGLTVIPGMELCTSEEAHVVCLFDSLDGAIEFDSYIYNNMPHIPNKAEIFGEQRILDENDELVGIEDNLLLVSSFISANDVTAIVQKYGGVAFPAHVDRSSYSLIASLGAIPPEANFKAAELTAEADFDKLRQINPELDSLFILRDSDSHRLEALTAEPNRIHLPERSAKAVIERIRKGV